MRLHGIANPYEQLKALTRGRRIDAETLREFIRGLDIPEPARRQLLELHPASYTGNAAAMAARMGEAADAGEDLMLQSPGRKKPR
jgi:adenylosuccinate lyase